jgi:hypothetical protein
MACWPSSPTAFTAGTLFPLRFDVSDGDLLIESAVLAGVNIFTNGLPVNERVNQRLLLVL